MVISRVPREAEGRLYHADTVGGVQREVRKAQEECRNVEATASRTTRSAGQDGRMRKREPLKAPPEHKMTPNQLPVDVLSTPSNRHANSAFKSEMCALVNNNVGHKNL